MTLAMRRFGVSLFVVVALGVGFVSSARADPSPGVALGCLNGDWAWALDAPGSYPSSYPTFQSEGQCINYLKHGGSLFTLVADEANGTVIAFIAFNDAGVITAISIWNSSPNVWTLPCGDTLSETIYNDSASYSITAGPGQTVTFKIPAPSPFFLYTAGPDISEGGPGFFHISANFGISGSGGSLC